MLAYRLRHRVTIQERVETQDEDTGAIEVVWQDATLGGVEMLDVPAEVLTGAGREFNNSASIQGEIAARINMRWFPGLTQKMRILWDGNTYNISSIETDLTARREYRLKCTAGVNEG